MNSNNPNPPNRLQLNFGLGDRNTYGTADAGRAFPTTPSTFPQPVFPNQAGQQEVWGAQQTKSGYGGAGYFMNNPYQPQYAQQQQQQSVPNSQAAYRAPGFNDGTNGLVQQFSHQNLGGAPRSSSPYARQQSPGQRSRTPGGGQQQQQYGNYLGGPPPKPQPPGVSLHDEEPPSKNPDKYADTVLKKAKISTGLVSNFFKDSVQRARDRNGRYVYLCKPRQDDWLSGAT